METNAFFSYPTSEQLQSIYFNVWNPIVKSSLNDHPIWGNKSKIRLLISSMVQLLEAVSY